MPRYKIRNIANSLNFDTAAASRNVTIDNTGGAVWNGSDSMTVFLRYKVRPVGSTVFPFAIAATTGNNRRYIQFLSNSKISVILGPLVGETVVQDAIRFNEWQSLALVTDVPNSRFRFYSNGVLVKDWAAFTPGTGFAPIGIGDNLAAAGGDFAGLESEVRLWNRVLTSEEIAAVEFNDVVPSDGLKGQWLLNEGTGNIATDTSGNGNNGFITGATWSTDTPFKARTAVSNRLMQRDMKASLAFSGVNQNVRYSAQPSLLLTGDVTLQAWVKHAGMSGIQCYIMMNTAGETEATNILYSISMQNSGKLRWLHEHGAGGNQTVVSTNAVIPPNAWCNIVAVRNATAKTISFYVDGVLIESIAYVNQTTGGSSDTLSIGETMDGADDFSGYMAEARIWNRVLSATEIADLHFMGTVPSSGLLLDPNFGQGTGTTIADRSPSGFTGTITGATFVADVPIKGRQPVNRNLVYNGDFEYAPPFVAATSTNSTWIDGTASGSVTNNLFGWGLYFGGGTMSARYDSAEKHSGSNSLKLAVRGGGSFIWVSQRRSAPSASDKSGMIPVLPGVSYTATGWMKTQYNSGTSNDGAYMRFREWDNNGVQTAATTSAKILTTTEWTQYTITKTTTAATRWLTLECLIVGDTGIATLDMDAWFDDIVLTPTTPTSRTLIS